MRKIVRQLRHGQITIPKEFRQALALGPDDLLAVTLAGGKIEIEPVRVSERVQGSEWAKRLYEAFGPVRASLSNSDEDDINQAIDDAVREARADPR